MGSFFWIYKCQNGGQSGAFSGICPGGGLEFFSFQGGGLAPIAP